MTTLGTGDARGARIRAYVRRLRSDETLARKASLNMVASILDYSARIVVGLLVLPILVSGLGNSLFGIYQTLGRLVGYATPAGGRPSQALKWTIAQRQSSADVADKRREVGSAIAVWLLFLPLLATAGGILAWFAPQILGVSDSLYTTVRVAAAILVAELIIGNLATIPQSVVQGENLGYKRMGLSTVVVLVGGGLTALAVVLGGGLVAVCAAVLATTLLTGLLFWWVARVNVPWFGVAKPAFGRARQFIRLSGWFLLWNLVMQVMRASDVVVLGIVGSSDLVTVYTLTRYIPEAIFGVVAIVVSAVMPGLGGLVGGGQLGRVATVRNEAMSVTWLIATASGATYLVLQESFLDMWVGPSYYPGGVTSLLVVLLMLQFALIRNDSSVIDVTLQLGPKVLLGIIAAGASVGLAVGLMKVDPSIATMALGFLLGRAILSVAYPIILALYVGNSALGQVWSALRPAVVTALAFGLALLVAPFVDVGSWILLALLSVVVVALFGAASYWGGLTGAQRRRLRERVGQVASAT
jgi:O-antigen/teichoic acid export membrane protein